MPKALNSNPLLEILDQDRCRRARSPSSPARRNWGRASGRRCFRSRRRNWLSIPPPSRWSRPIPAGRRTRATPPAASRCRKAAPRSCTRRRGCAGILRDLAAERFGVPADTLRLGQGAVAAPDGRSLGYGELVADGALEGARPQRGTVLKDPASLQRDRPRPAARRYPRQGDRRRRLCPGHAAARHGPCPRRAPAQLRRRASARPIPAWPNAMPGVARHRSRRQLSGGRGGAGMAGDQRHARAGPVA